MSAPHSPGGVRRARDKMSASYRNLAAGGMCLLCKGTVVFHAAAVVWILDDAAENVGSESGCLVAADFHVNSLRNGACADNGQHLRKKFLRRQTVYWHLPSAVRGCADRTSWWLLRLLLSLRPAMNSWTAA